MDYEYAVDPQAIATSWDRFQNIISRFGFENGRLISDYPQRKWSDKVRHAAEKNKLGDYEWKKICDGLDKAKRESKIKRFGRDPKRFNDNLNWLRNAVNEHEENGRFGAIIAYEANCKNENIFSAESFLEDNLGRKKQIESSINSLVAAFHIFLRFGRRIEFIDPYFRIDRKVTDSNSRKLIHRSLKIVNDFNKHRDPSYRCCKIRIHYKDQDGMPTISHIGDNIQRYTNLVPKGMSLEIFRWRRRENCPVEFHGRHLLTDKGGLFYDPGFTPRGGNQKYPLIHWSECEARDRLKGFALDDSGHELVEDGLRIRAGGETRRIDS